MYAVLNFIILPVPDGLLYFCEQFLLTMTSHDRTYGEWRLMDWEQVKSIMTKLRNGINNFYHTNFSFYRGICDCRVGTSKSAGHDGHGESFFTLVSIPSQ
jgi:hypothetical protein